MQWIQEQQQRRERTSRNEEGMKIHEEDYETRGWEEHDSQIGEEHGSQIRSRGGVLAGV